MKGLLVRVGCDQTPDGGQWNAPVDVASGRFCYVPIPESKPSRPGLLRPYTEVSPALEELGVALPADLRGRGMHLDPDFEFLTYGDRGKKGRQIQSFLGRGDFIAFYSGLRDLRSRSLVYALIGLLVVDRMILARDIPSADWNSNAHCRREIDSAADDIVVLGIPKLSGRLSRSIVIGEFRDRAYRVTRPLLEAWGGISSNDGYLQRSAVFPRIEPGERFMQWLDAEKVLLYPSNWDRLA